MRPVLAAILGVLLGLALGFAAGVSRPPAETTAVPPETARDAPAASDAAAETPRASRADLEGELAALREELAALRAEASEEEAEEEQAADPGFDLAALEAAGWLPAEIERLRARFEAWELDRLYLRNQARREGWLGTGRFRRERRDLREELRNELGDEDFDALLYGSGGNNRVRVLKLLEDSPAGAAGVRAGDEIHRYAGERVFDPFSLVRLTAEGEPGRNVELRVMRNGEEIRTFVPRGPLGVRLQQTQVAPSRRG